MSLYGYILPILLVILGIMACIELCKTQFDWVAFCICVIYGVGISILLGDIIYSIYHV